VSILVVDASVVLKWFLPEVHSAAARDLLQEAHQFVVPDLLFPEVCNAIWKKVRRGELSRNEAQRLVADIEAIAVESIPTHGLMGDASAIAFASAQTVYDCVYLALAVRLETRVITADERFERAITSNPMLAKHICMVDALAP
jgi:predicted nucleic acid-binding protein